MSNFDPNQSPTDPQPQPQSQYSPPPQTQPAPGYTPPPQTVYQQPAPKKSNRNIFLIIGGVLLLLICGCIGAFALGIGGIFAATQPVADAGERFMVAFRDGNYNSAYNMFTPSLQSRIGGADRIEEALQASRPTKWSFNSRNISNDTGQLQGTMTLVDGREADLQLDLANVGGEWKISGIDIEPR